MNSLEPTNQKQPDETQKQDTIFDDITDLSVYEKGIKSTRNWLYLVAGIWLVWGIINFNKVYDQQLAYLILGEYLFVSLSFLAFGLWSRRKPAMAFLIAIIFYVLLNAWLLYTASITFQSVLIRVVIIISVVKGYRDARKYEELKQTMIYPEAED